MRLAFRQVLPVALPVIILNLFFLWDSQVLDYLTGPVFGAHSCVNSVCYHTSPAYIIENGIYSMVGSVFVNPFMGAGPRVALLIGIDGVSLVCALVLFVTFYRRYSREGRTFGLLKSVQLTDLCILPLGLELWLDYALSGSEENYAQLNAHVVSLQGYLGVLGQFTNLDLFYASVLVFALTTLVVRVGFYRGAVLPRRDL